MNKFEDLCAELDNLDIVYQLSPNSGINGEYALFIGDSRRGSSCRVSYCYMIIAYNEEIDAFSYNIVIDRRHGVKITKSKEEVLARVARFYFEEYENV